jgi:DNA-binding NarL/FixJ family response regulator
MHKDIHVIIVEDDPYARDFMSMLLRRDWRTRVVGEYGSDCGIELHHALRQATRPVDVLLIDTEVPTDEQWPLKVAQITRSLAQPPALLYTCTAPSLRILEQVLALNGRGYLAKREILYGLAAAITAAAQGQFVITPGVQMIAGQVELPERLAVLDGMIPVAHFTPREHELTRLGLLFNLEQRDIADELVVGTDFVAELMGQVYDKLGLHELLRGEKSPETCFTDEMLLAHCRELLAQSPPSPTHRGHKTPWMSTLAFHLLTQPETEEMAGSAPGK